MPTILKINKPSHAVVLVLTTAVLSFAKAADLFLPAAHGLGISINIENKHVFAKDEKKKITYAVERPISKHLAQADEISLISNASTNTEQLFLVLSREASRPEFMGRGYCGAGHEDYLLLIQIQKDKVILRDQFLLQSCLKNLSLMFDQGDDHLSKDIAPGKDGSIIYSLTSDGDKERVLSIDDKHFKVKIRPSSQ